MIQKFSIRCLASVCSILAIGSAQAVDINLSDTQPFANQASPSAIVQPMDGGNKIYLYGNIWQATTARFNIASNSMLEFEFSSDGPPGEIHGIGFDPDNRLRSNLVFKLRGTQSWGVRGVASYTATPGQFQKFSIPVGEYYTGNNMRLLLVNDKDSGERNNSSQFRNVKLVTTGSEDNQASGGEVDNLVAGNCQNNVQKDLLAAHNKARSQGRSCGGTFYPPAPALKWNCTLASAAKNHSQDMATNNFFNHSGSDGLQVWDRARNLGYDYRAIAENIAAGYADVDSVVSGWLGSSGHCKNIMNKNYKEMGAAKVDNASSNYRSYWTGVFGTQH